MDFFSPEIILSGAAMGIKIGGKGGIPLRAGGVPRPPRLAPDSMGHTLKAVQLVLLSKKPRTETSDKWKDHGEAGNRASSLVLPLPLWLTLSGLSFMDLSFYPYRELTELGPSSVMLVSIQVAAVMRGYGLGACQMGCVKNSPLYIYLYILEHPGGFLQCLAFGPPPSPLGHTFSSRPLGSLVLKAPICNYFTNITKDKSKVCALFAFPAWLF